MYYYSHDITGKITGLVDGSGNLVVEYTYTPYGKVLTTTGTAAGTLGVANPFRYKDYYLDSETGLYYLQSRYYNYDWCRFINVDDMSILQMPQGQLLGVNLFAYCGNNAVMMSDWNGNISIRAIILYCRSF
jgi:RHS repeat-associated protein